jgi:hypothetical protein
LENPENIQKYYLQDDFSKLHFEVQDLKSYFDRHKAQASKAHTHGFINYGLQLRNIMLTME